MRPAFRSLAFVSLHDLTEVCHSHVRLELLLSLRRGPMDVGALAAGRELALKHVSHHLRALAGAGLVSYATSGHRHLYSLNPTAVVVSAEGALDLTICGDDGSRVALHIPASVAEMLLQGARSAGIHAVSEFPRSSVASEPLRAADAWEARAACSAPPGRDAEGPRPGRA